MSALRRQRQEDFSKSAWFAVTVAGPLGVHNETVSKQQQQKVASYVHFRDPKVNKQRITKLYKELGQFSSHNV